MNIQCTITLHLREIYIIPEAAGEDQTERREGIYGHEQKHVTSLHSQLRKLGALLEKNWEEGKGCMEKIWCGVQARNAERDGQRRLEMIWKLEIYHANPGSPPTGIPVPPTGPLPSPLPDPEAPK